MLSTVIKLKIDIQDKRVKDRRKLRMEKKIKIIKLAATLQKIVTICSVFNFRNGFLIWKMGCVVGQLI